MNLLHIVKLLGLPAGYFVSLRGFIPSLVLGLLNVRRVRLTTDNLSGSIYGNITGYIKVTSVLNCVCNDENKRKTILKISNAEITLSTRTFSALSDPHLLLLSLMQYC